MSYMSISIDGWFFGTNQADNESSNEIISGATGMILVPNNENKKRDIVLHSAPLFPAKVRGRTLGPLLLTAY